MTDYSSLNEPQKTGAFTTEGPVLILAGAGSGKTRVLTYRTAHLIEQGVPPFSILAITFTNKAAAEMKERIQDILGGDKQGVWVSTFHSFCLRILRLFCKDAGFSPSFAVYDTDDQKSLMKSVLKRMDIDSKRYKEKEFLNAISRAKDRLITPSDYALEAGNEFYPSMVAKVYAEYQACLHKNDAMDFDDLIMKTVLLLRSSESAVAYCLDRFKYIMVDEYQDTNVAQFELVRLLAGESRNLCVVGDDDQSIYRFRGANIYNILNFEHYFPEAKVIKLEENYRSTGNILSAANAVIKNNKSRKDKTLWTSKGAGEPLRLKVLENAFEEAEYIVDEVRRANRRGEPWNSSAVLYRTNAQSRVLEEKFIYAGVPYKIVGGTNFYSRREVKDVLAYLHTIQNASDDISVRRILNVPKRGIGQTTINKVISYAEAGDISFFDALRQADRIPSIGAAAKRIEGFVNLIRVLRASAEGMSVQDLISKLTQDTGYMEELRAEDKAEGSDREENVQELINKAAEFSRLYPDSTLSDFLQEVSLVADIDSLDSDQDHVVLMTVHGAKGLEFRRVFLAGMEDGLFPGFMSIMSDASDEDLEEERRLCYVGITRAKEELCITSARSRMVRGELQYSKLSRFVEEIPDELFGGDRPSNVKRSRTDQATLNFGQPRGGYGYGTLKYDGATSYGGRGMSRHDETASNYDRGIPRAAARASLSSVAKKGSAVKETPVYAEGDRVRHIKFGDGTVLSIRDAGRDYEVTVDFDGQGVKKLFAGFAKLQKI